jgi:trk system potassium uptake protein TrkH
MTFTTFFITILGGISLRERVLLSEIFNEKSLAKISSTITRILLLTFTIEFIGAIALFNFLPDSLFKNKSDKIFHSVFHSISAFCNAGFSTFSNNLIAIKYNAPAILTIAFLFIAGGLGFIVLTEYTEKPILRLLRSVKFFRERIQPQSVTLSLHSKLALSTTFILIIFGTFSFFVLEFNNTLKGESFFYKVIHSFFQAVTPRTAGFNTLDISQISVATSLLIIFLMWVGASPGSTGGGIKTTSFALIILKIISIINGRGKVEIFKKQVHEETVMRAFVSAIFSILILSVATFFLTLIETGKSLIDLLFEVVSAFGTVGLSRGVTSNLTNVGKLIIIMMMFIGRVGVLTVSFALFGRIERRNYEFQKENILVT